MGLISPFRSGPEMSNSTHHSFRTPLYFDATEEVTLSFNLYNINTLLLKGLSLEPNEGHGVRGLLTPPAADTSSR